ncbi:MAG TPA: flagellar synthesis regulator FleN [Syntrophobacteraceae bacterium]|nr:flagellar synthesis regulator FleN [Syntrophobacteraceae bacterium]HBD10436.1 flagellar synthesis regulator FleN [Syntrophobacteraceae bacterium]
MTRNSRTHNDHSDQAAGLRRVADSGSTVWHAGDVGQVLTPSSDPGVRVMAISSGKGGVGKSSVVVNLAVAFDHMGKRVLIMDADLGLANVDILMGISPKYHIGHILDGSRQLEEVLVKGPGKILVMPASSGVQQLTHLTDEQKLVFLEMLDGLEADIDILLIDTGAGISDTVLYFNIAAQERIVVVTAEPTSLTDAYALIKVLYTRHGERHFKILTNNVKDDHSGKNIFLQISKVADHFLDGLSLDYLGNIPSDPNVARAVIQQKPLLEVFPQSPASKAFANLASRLDKSLPPQFNQGSIQFFWKRLLNV